LVEESEALLEGNTSKFYGQLMLWKRGLLTWQGVCNTLAQMIAQRDLHFLKMSLASISKREKLQHSILIRRGS